MHEIPARSKLAPRIPITSPQFVYRRARDTDVRLTFARAQGGLDPSAERVAPPAPWSGKAASNRR